MSSFCLFKNFKRIVIIAVIGLGANLLIWSLAQMARAEQVFYWDELLKVYDAYVDYPSPENAKALLDALPADTPLEEIGDARRGLRHIFSSDNYPVLYEEAVCGDGTAIEIYFRLLNITDGFYSEVVMSTLGLFVRVQPQLFLELLSVYKNTKHIKWHGYPVSFVGTGHNIHMKARVHILEKRVEALETVKDPKFTELNEDCIKELRARIIKVNQFIKHAKLS